MRVLKKGAALFLCLVMLLTIPIVGPQPESFAVEPETAVTANAVFKEIDSFGNIHLDIPGDDFFKMGFEYGDVVTATIGEVPIDMPVCGNLFDVDAFAPVCLVKDSHDYEVVLCENVSNLAEDLELSGSVGMPVTITMKEKGGYLEIYQARQITRTNAREDYPDLSEEEFANFRVVSTTGMGEKILYRGSSPLNPSLNRNTIVMASIEKFGIKTILNACDSDESMKEYATYPGSYYAGCNVIPLEMKSDFLYPDFEQKLVSALRYMIDNPGPYYVHCVEGKDRTGYICAVLEALMGASADEILDDYMVTYYNYYGVKPDEKRYEIIREGNLPKTLAAAFGIPDIKTADLAEASENYMKKIGLKNDEIQKLRERLSPDSAIYKLKANKTCKKYDVTGDGKSDKIRVKYKKNKEENNSIQIYVNSKRIYKKKGYYIIPQVRILQFDKKKQLIEAGYTGEDGWNSIHLYGYQKKKWKMVRNLNDCGISKKYSYGGNANIKCIDADCIRVEYSHQMPMIGADKFVFTYYYDGNQLNKTSGDVVIKINKYKEGTYNATGYKANTELVAKRKMTVYADANTSSEKIAEIHKNDSVVFFLMRVVSKRPWFYVITKDTVGWLPADIQREDDNDSSNDGQGYYFKWLFFYG